MNQSTPWMMYTPTSEQEVIVLFALLLPHLPTRYQLEEVRAKFPDCLAYRVSKKRKLIPVRIEFELYASNFLVHGHNQQGCDLIVCWKDDLRGLRGFEVPRLALAGWVKRVAPPMIALPMKPKYEVTLWDRESFLAKCTSNLRKVHVELLEWAERHGTVIFGKGDKIPSWTFAVRRGDDQRCILFGVYPEQVWPTGFQKLPRDRRMLYEECLRRVPRFKAALAEGKPFFFGGIQEKGVLQALKAAVSAVAT